MKVSVLQCSPVPEGRSVSKMIAASLSKGLSMGGATITEFDIAHADMKNCLVCYDCWCRTPGVCVIDDQMTREIFPSVMESDLMVIVSPILHGFISSSCKTFLERMVPQTHHEVHLAEFMKKKQRWRERQPLVYTILTGGKQKSDQQYITVEDFFRHEYGEYYLGGISFGNATVYAHHWSLKSRFNTFLSTVTIAGKELAKTQKVSPFTKKYLDAEPADFLSLLQRSNLVVESCIYQHISMNKFLNGSRSLYPITIDSFFMYFSMILQDKKADSQFAIQFTMTGKLDFCFVVEADKTSVSIVEGEGLHVKTFVSMDYEDILDVLSMGVSFQELEKKQRITVVGERENVDRLLMLMVDPSYEGQIY